MERFDALLFTHLADEETAVLLYDHTVVKPLHDDSLTIGGMDDTIVALNHMDIIANDGIAVVVARQLFVE